MEDDFEHAEIVATILRRHGYAVEVAHDGLTALARARACPPRAILLDLYMPIIDGVATARRLLSDPRTCDVPIVFVSASGELAARRLGGELPSVGFLAKPFHAAELLARVDRLVGASGEDAVL